MLERAKIMTPSLLELCDHARRSCTVNGLAPKEWRWGFDASQLYAAATGLPDGFLPYRHQGLPVHPMRALGVACIGKKPYVSLLKKE